MNAPCLSCNKKPVRGELVILAYLLVFRLLAPKINIPSPLPPSQRPWVNPQQSGHLLLADTPAPAVGLEPLARTPNLSIPGCVAQKFDKFGDAAEVWGDPVPFPICHSVRIHPQQAGHVFLKKLALQTPL